MSRSRDSVSLFITPSSPQAGEGLRMEPDLLSGCHVGLGGSDDVSQRIIPGQEEDSRRCRRWGQGFHVSLRKWAGVSGVLEQHKANSSEVKVFWEVGWVSHPRREAVGLGGGAYDCHMAVTGAT